MNSHTDHARDVVNHNRGLCISVVHWSEGVKPLLSRCVPNFKLDCLVSNLALLGQKRGYELIIQPRKFDTNKRRSVHDKKKATMTSFSIKRH